MKLNRILLAGLVLGMTATALAACAQPQAASSKLQAPTKRSITIAAVEPKGSAAVEKEAFPKDELPPGGGYVLVAPDKNGSWGVETYRWDTSTIVVNQGDEVTLELIGVNGKEHAGSIEGYNINFAVKRGQLTKVSFTADKPGIFKFLCSTHMPSMTADLVVLAR